MSFHHSAMVNRQSSVESLPFPSLQIFDWRFCSLPIQHLLYISWVLPSGDSFVSRFQGWDPSLFKLFRKFILTLLSSSVIRVCHVHHFSEILVFLPHEDPPGPSFFGLWYPLPASDRLLCQDLNRSKSLRFRCRVLFMGISILQAFCKFTTTNLYKG